MYEHLLVLSLCVKSFFPPNGSEARGHFVDAANYSLLKQIRNVSVLYIIKGGCYFP